MLGDACLNTFLLEVRPHLAAALAHRTGWKLFLDERREAAIRFHLIRL